MFIDTHAHIYLKEFEKDLDTILVNAQSNGVSHILMPNIDEASMPLMIDVAKSHSFCHSMLGLHPCHVYDDYKKVIENLWKQYGQHTFYAVGEIGIDLYWDKTFHLEQVDAFKRQIALAKEVNLPFVIHSRDALDITISIVQEMQDGSLRGIFHCFNGDEMQAHKIIDAGFLLGIGGVVTYKNAGLDKVMAHMPLSSLVLETDAPYLSPIPYRGKRNEPAYILQIATKLAEVKNTTIEEVGLITTQNAKELFF
ncbi:MAG: TatD family hydrolase [Saprospiraceae bacterium]|jgi:TatD DNase family protein|nr:TatD family hydrolase [Saprospiraceae bacterium]